MAVTVNQILIVIAPNIAEYDAALLKLQTFESDGEQPSVATIEEDREQLTITVTHTPYQQVI